MTTKHTPGPWKIFGPMVDGETYGIDGEDGSAVVYYGHRGTANGIPKKADAYLIAAAPELMEALQDLADDIVERFDMDSPSTNPGIKHCINAARAALAKARGET